MTFTPVADSILREVGAPWRNGLKFEQNLASMVVNITMPELCMFFSLSLYLKKFSN